MNPFSPISVRSDSLQLAQNGVMPMPVYHRFSGLLCSEINY